jgi:hypothetical protein
MIRSFLIKAKRRGKEERERGKFLSDTDISARMEESPQQREVDFWIEEMVCSWCACVTLPNNPRRSKGQGQKMEFVTNFLRYHFRENICN